MKFKLHYIYFAYEAVTFLHEMYKRKATSIRFELQESVGKVNIYIDDSSFKQIDGHIAWKVVKSMYSFIAKKENRNEEFDKDKDMETTINQEDFDKINKKFKFNILPLPKGKSIGYSYIKKSGDIYEVAFSLVSNDLDSFILEHVKDKQELIHSNVDLFFTDEDGTVEVETVSLKKKNLSILFTNEDEETGVRTFKTDLVFTNKKSVTSFFDKFSTLNESALNTSSVEKETTNSEDEKQLDTKDSELVKISW